MGKTLYRSYRSQSFDEIVGQDHITVTLKNALKNKAIAHAYLLSGPRGVGKTSVARILAYAVNEQPYSLEATNLDIIEIDAASHRRIDEVREIREKVRIAPTNGKYKVYIIDEVHMLTKEAFNALLKTLEEPPEHAIFILATTEPNKLPDTIISRCIHFSFKAIEPDVITEHLVSIAKKEHIKISDDALKLLAEHSKGSFRDALSLLQQVNYISKDISESEVSLMLGVPSASSVKSIISAIENNDILKLTAALNNGYEFGASPQTISYELQKSLRGMLVGGKKSKLGNKNILNILKELLDVPGSSQPELKLEIILSTYALEQHPSSSNESNKATAALNIKRSAAKEVPLPIKSDVLSPRPIIEDISTDKWQDFLQKLKKKNNTLYGIMRVASYKEERDVVIFSFKFNFHKKQVDDTKNFATINKLIHECFGENVSAKTALITSDNTEHDNRNIKNLSNIFGNAEVLES